MNILHWISVIALYSSFFYGAEGQATCALAYDDGTELTSTDWSWGITLGTIEDVTEPGTILATMTATDISVIWSSEPDSTSGYNYMDTELINGQFIVSVSDYFTQYEELETETTMRMQLNFGCSVNNRTLNVNVPITDTNNNAPVFQNAPYTYELPIPLLSGFAIQSYGAISARDIDLTNTYINFTLNSSDPIADGFSASWLSRDTTDIKLHYAELITTALLSIEESITFDIFATDNGSPSLTTQTTITIVVDEENSVPPNPVFGHTVYIADHSGITIEEASGSVISFNQGDVTLSQGFDSTVEYTIVDNIGSYEDNFLITISEDYSYITLALQDVTEELLAERYVILTLTATRSRATYTGITILHIDLPGIISSCSNDTSTITTEENDSSNTTTTEENDSSNTTTTEENDSSNTTTTEENDSSNTTTTENDNSDTTTTTEDNSSDTTTTTIAAPTLSFPTSIYRFDKDSTFTGVLMTQIAEVTNAEGTIKYSATFDDVVLASYVIIDPDSAALEITAVISPGVYTFEILATIEELELSASATVILVISSVTECDGEIVFGYALQIIELEEESAHENILPLDDNGCNYSIYSQSPSQDLFSITDNYLNSVAIDREATYFSSMSVAQVRVIIDASCSNNTVTDTETTISKRDTEHEILTENIAYERTRTVLIVIITDINDNYPVWSSDTPTYIGFPGYELAQLIHVPYVYKFSATDADIGDNAVVSYTLTSGSETFYVQNSEGSVYIRQGVYVEDGLQFTIVASDGTLETPKEVNVRMLESSNVVVLFVTGGVLEDVDNIIENLSSSTGYWVRSVGAAVISESDVSSSKSLRSVSRRMRRASDANTLLRLVVYSLDNTVPVDSEILVSAVETADLTWTISESAALEAVLPVTINSDALTELDTRGYWATIIVLSVLLFLTVVAAGIVYFVFCRRGKATSTESNITYENFENTNSQENTRNHKVKSVTLSESQDDVEESTDASNADWVLNKTKLPEKANFESSCTFSSLKGSNDDDFVFITRNENVANAAPQAIKKKSVAFKATVEEIEVARL